MKGKNEGKIKALNNKIKIAEGLIASNPQSEKAYAQKASGLAELGSLTGKKEDYDRALEMYNKAISLDPENQQYILARSKLHASMGNTTLAAQDATRAQKEMEESGSSGSASADIAFRKTMKDVLKLDGVQQEIERMIKTGELPKELSGVFENMLGVISGISARVSEHDNRLDEHEADIKDVRERLLKLEELQQHPACIRLIKTMEEKIILLEAQITKHSQAIDKIEEKILTIVSKEEFEQLAIKLSSLALNTTFFEGRLKIAEGKLGDQGKLLVAMDKTLQETNIYREQEIKSSFEELRASNPALYEYANSFNWTLNNYLLAYRAVSTGMVEGAREKGKFESMWEKVGSPIMSMMGIVPVVGGILPVIEANLSLINNAYKNMAFDRKVQKINSIIQSSNILLEKDLSLAVAKSAATIAKARATEIIEYCKEKEEVKSQSKGKLAQSSPSPLQQLNKSIDKAIEQFNDNIELLLTKATHISKTDISHAGEKAIKDVILFINYIATHDNALNIQAQNQIQAQSQSPSHTSHKDIDRVITEAFHNMSLKANGTNAALSLAVNQNTNMQAPKNPVSGAGDCTICKADQFTYDNELLNHPELLRKAMQIYGSRALDLSAKLAPDFIKEAVQEQEQGSDGYDLLLAGLVRLDHNIDLN